MLLIVIKYKDVYWLERKAPFEFEWGFFYEIGEHVERMHKYWLRCNINVMKGGLT
jgi:hypothetical protein